MVAGFERYCQIARCFRDEDLRADRQPEFTQIDLEMSFLSRDEILSLIEAFVVRLWKDCLNVQLQTPFERISYATAMQDYGSDKPDARFGLKLKSVSSILANTGFQVFSSAIKNGGNVIALPVRRSELEAASVSHPTWSRKFFDELNPVVQPFGMKGVAWGRVENGALQSPIAKFLKAEELSQLLSELALAEGDYVFFGADASDRVFEAMGTLRLHLAKELGLIQKGVSSVWKFLWVVDFPLLVKDPSTGDLSAAHHPFTRPLAEDAELFMSGDRAQLHKVRAEAYDLALNGFEIAGGSLRIFDPKVQARMFEV
jgi:aspartyl-tRNA synthetase